MVNNSYLNSLESMLKDNNSPTNQQQTILSQRQSTYNNKIDFRNSNGTIVSGHPTSSGAKSFKRGANQMSVANNKTIYK